MKPLHEVLASEVQQWRENSFACPDFPAIKEILDYQRVSETGDSRYLRVPQLRALEVYWYLRLLRDTPRIPELYQQLYSSHAELISALGVSRDAFEKADYSIERLWNQVRNDDQFVRDFRLEALRETLTLDYPSYIFALAMGAGKTALIGAIIATEFAMAMEYPQANFAANALVFAPGKTILEALRELAQLPYDRILPPRFSRLFMASLKLTFTRDGERDVPVVPGSLFNVVVTNTEKIRITAESIRKTDLGALFSDPQADEAKREVANRRLQTIASLPRLAVFSDEAHHLYGQSLGAGLKRVRQTVDYLAANTRVVCVVNTTGTPYYRRQLLKDVVIWYGLSEGIADGYLKEVAGNILAYDFGGNVQEYVAHVITDFFGKYKDVRLPDGSPAKLAMYFPQTTDLVELKPVIERTLVEVGLSPSVCLVNVSDVSLTKPEDVASFNRLNDPRAPHRVILLVNKGTEGWNCPSLFACALVRRLKTSNNFVLQAASRCLRQVPGNREKAHIYLSQDNFAILDNQLRETYGTTVSALNHGRAESIRTRIVVRKTDISPLTITQVVRTVVKKDTGPAQLSLTRPQRKSNTLTRRVFGVGAPVQDTTQGVLRQMGETITVDVLPDSVDCYTMAAELARIYRLNVWMIYDQLRIVYGAEDIPLSDFSALAQQVEAQTTGYTVIEERVERTLAIVRLQGFNREGTQDGKQVYTAEIMYPKDREHLLLHHQMICDNRYDFGFHYTPYNFDSGPERDFFTEMLRALNESPDQVEDIYFTGALTDPKKTDFYVTYKDNDGTWRNYTPDFIIRRKDGKTLIVEVKKEHDRKHPIDGEDGKKAMALRQWEALNPDKIRYEIIFTKADTVPYDLMRSARVFARGGETHE